MADWPSSASSFTNSKAKGFAFTADAALAAIVFVVVMASLSSHSVFEPTPRFSDLELVRNMDASLEILDQAGTLQDLNAVEIHNDLNSVLPHRMGWQISIEKYRPSGQDFNLVASTNVGDWSTDLNQVDFIEGRRLFLDFNATDVSGYYNAEWRVWFK